MCMLRRFLCVGLSSMLWVPAMAHDNHQHSHPPTTTAAHVHGEASLNIVIDGGTLLAAFSSPMDNLLGFEHAPETATEKQAYQELQQTLEDYRELFSVEPGVCEQARHQLQGPFDNHEDQTAQQNHSELQVEYFLHCQQAAKISGVATSVFSAYPRLETLKVQVIHDHGQSSFTLTPGHDVALWQ